MKYVFREGVLVPKVEQGPPAQRSDFPAPFFSRFEPMESPVTGQMIFSERQRQRDMEEHGAYDPRDVKREKKNGRGTGPKAGNDDLWGKWSNRALREQAKPARNR